MTSTKRTGKRLVDVVLAVVLAVAIFLGCHALAQKAHNSALLTQSRILRQLVADDSVDFMAIIKDENQRDVLKRFVAALANAYVSFELIPINEGDTLMAVISSLEPGIHVDAFAYQGRDLMIYGRADNRLAFDRLVWNLRNTDYFARVEPESWDSEAGPLEFAIACRAKEVTLPPFLNGERGRVLS